MTNTCGSRTMDRHSTTTTTTSHHFLVYKQCTTYTIRFVTGLHQYQVIVKHYIQLKFTLQQNGRRHIAPINFIKQYVYICSILIIILVCYSRCVCLFVTLSLVISILPSPGFFKRQLWRTSGALYRQICIFTLPWIHAVLANIDLIIQRVECNSLRSRKLYVNHISDWIQNRL